MPAKIFANRPNRSSMVFLAGLIATAGLALYADDWGRARLTVSNMPVSGAPARAVRPHRQLTATDRQDAAVAWRYFEHHFRPDSGFVDSVSGYPSGTLWDQGSYLLALISARGLALIDDRLFDARVAALLAGLGRIELFEGRLPNKVYHSITLEMVDYKNRSSAKGVGWSALDIARMLAALRVLEIRYPAYGPRIREVMSRWTLDAMAQDGRLAGATRQNGRTEHHQEGRIGYEQYGARSAALWGLDVLAAGTAAPIVDWQRVASVNIPVDRRRASVFRAITPTLSEPFFLQGLEMGFNAETALLADRVYSAQEARHAQTGQITMVSEGNIDQAPHFLYASVFSNGEPWAVVAENGSLHPDLRTISLKAAFAWDALFGTAYTARVRATLSGLATEKGWASGLYESDNRINSMVTANTNAVVLEALHFKLKGPLLALN